MYTKGQELVVVETITDKDGNIKLEKDEKVDFFTIYHDPADLSQCKIAVKKQDDEQTIIVTKEVNVKPTDEKLLKQALKEVSLSLERNNPRLRAHSANYLKRYFFKARYFISDNLDRVRLLLVKILGGK